MKTLLYIGNQLENKGRSASTIDTLGPLLETVGYKVRYASSEVNVAKRFFIMVYAIVKYGRQSDFVLIDTYSTLNFYYAFLCAQLCRMIKVAYIPLLHGGNLPKRLENSPVMSRLIFDNAYCNVAPSEYLKRRFVGRGFRKIELIPNTISLADFPFFARVAIEPKLIWVRSLAEIYNPMMALEVLKILQATIPSASLKMIGPDKENMLSSLKDFAQSEKLNVEFCGKLTRKQWSEMSKHYDILINTSSIDNMPVSLLEASSLGLYIVSTDVGGIPDLYAHSETAMLSPAKDATQMAANIVKLIDDKELQKYLQLNSLEFVKQFDWNKIQKKWHILFSKTDIVL